MHYIFLPLFPSTDHLLWSSIFYLYVYILFNLANFKFEQYQGKWNEKSSQCTVHTSYQCTHSSTHTHTHCTVACDNKSVNLIWKIITDRSVEGKGKNCDKFCVAIPDLRVRRSGGNTTPSINQFTDEEFNRTARARSVQSTKHSTSQNASTTIIICPGMEVN